MKLIEALVFVFLLLLITAGIIQSLVVSYPLLTKYSSYKEQYTSIFFIYEDFQHKTEQGKLRHEQDRQEWIQSLENQFKVKDAKIVCNEAKNKENLYVVEFNFLLYEKQFEMLSVFEAI